MSHALYVVTFLPLFIAHTVACLRVFWCVFFFLVKKSRFRASVVFLLINRTAQSVPWLLVSDRVWFVSEEVKKWFRLPFRVR